MNIKKDFYVEMKTSFYTIQKQTLGAYLGKSLSILFKFLVGVLILALLAVTLPDQEPLLLGTINELMQVEIGNLLMYVNSIIYGIALLTYTIPVVSNCSKFLSFLSLTIGSSIFSALAGISLGLAIVIQIDNEVSLPPSNWVYCLVFIFGACLHYISAIILLTGSKYVSFLNSGFGSKYRETTVARYLFGIVFVLIGLVAGYDYISNYRV